MIIKSLLMPSVALFTTALLSLSAIAGDDAPKGNRPNLVDPQFLKTYCADCHHGPDAAGGLELLALPHDLAAFDVRRKWVKIHDRLAAGEMPPADATQPTIESRNALLQRISSGIIAAELQQAAEIPRLRRLTRSEYENTIRDLFQLPGIALAGLLPADGSAHGFDKHVEALDISHVNVAKYLQAADHILTIATATRPQPPVIRTRRISLANRGGFVAHILMNGDGVLLKDGQPDPEFPPAGDQNHIDLGAHEKLGSFRNGASVGLFRHEDESVNPYFSEHVTIYPGHYRVRTSLWGFQWDKGKVVPGRGTEAARLSVVQLTGDGRGGQHPSYVLGYFDAPADTPLEHELTVWLNPNEQLGFNAASLAPVANYSRKGRAMAFTGPGIVVDWLDIEGPLYESWPPASHRLLFGDLPLREWIAAEHPGQQPPPRDRPRQIGAGLNRPDPEPGIYTVQPGNPLQEAESLLSRLLPQLFRRPVDTEVVRQYLKVVQVRLEAGDCFEVAMKSAYRRALCSPDFLYHFEGDESNSANELAARLSYFLWNSTPDEHLRQLASDGRLSQPKILHAEIERLLADPRSTRFVDDFLGQWLKLRQIGTNDPDRKLYPEFSPYLQDCMIAETRAYFRELLDGDLDALHLLKSDFVTVNQKLAAHYDIQGVNGTFIRRVPLPEDCPRGGLITQASILKITANGTTTSPVPRGAFILDRLLGGPPEPPPASVAAIEPDVRGTTTIRDQLAKHREQVVCASCHQKIDPPGFALECFDVIGGHRQRYRSIGDGDVPKRGKIDPLIPLSFRLGPAVDATGELPDGRTFAGIREYQEMMSQQTGRLLENLAKQLLVYGTGHELAFRERKQMAVVLERTNAEGGGIRTLFHELIASPLFIRQPGTRSNPPATNNFKFSTTAQNNHSRRMMMMPVLPPVPHPVIAESSPPPPAIPSKVSLTNPTIVELRVTGLFSPEREGELRALFAAFPEAEVRSVDFGLATATIAYDSQSPMFRNALAEQVVQRLNSRMRQLSSGTFGVRPDSEVPRERWQQVVIPIVGLPCQACSLGVYEILMRVDGVEQATASFREGRAMVWIDPEKTSAESLRQALKMRNVQLADQ